MKQAGLGALVGSQRVEFIAAHGAEQNCIGVECGCKRVCGQWRAILHNGDAADALRFKIKCVAAEGCDFAQHSDCFVGDFGTDAVAGGD